MARGAFRRGGDIENRERWEYLESLDVDVALVQEASPPPIEMATRWQVWPNAANLDGWPIGRSRDWGSGIVVFNHDLRLVGIPTVRLGDPLPEGSDRYPPTALWASHPGAFAVGLLHGL